MNQLTFKPSLYQYKACRDFVSDFSIGEGDLIITSKTCYQTFLEPLHLLADVIFPRDYGSGEPTDAMVTAMYQDIAKKSDYQRVIGIGGGSVLDLAKLFVLETIFPLTELFDRNLPVKKVKPLLLVPTTCGTGSEVTNISVLSFLERGSKQGLADDELFADAAILIPQLMSNLPYEVFATSSIDALIHAIESSLSPRATRYTKLFGYQAITMIMKGYQKIALEKVPYQELLEEFLVASNFAGLAFGTAGCGTVHAMSFPLSGTFHVAHGEANYALLEGVLSYYEKSGVTGELLELNTHLSMLLNCSLSEVTTQLTLLLGQILKRQPLSAYGTTKQHCTDWANLVIAKQQRLMRNSLIPLTAADLTLIYESLL